MAEPASPSPAPPPARPRRSSFDGTAGSRARGPSKLLVVAGAALLGLGGLFAYYRLVLSDSARHHEFKVDWPVAAPRGEAIAIGHELKAGDVFERRIESHFRILLSVDDNVDITKGMNLDVGLMLAQGIEAGPFEAGAGLKSRWKIVVEKAASNPGEWSAAVHVMLGSAAMPFGLEQDLDPSGRPLAPPIGGAASAGQRRVLDSVLCGLGDLTTNYLPPHDVRLGDVWDLDEAVRLPGIVTIVRYVSKTDDYAAGYPPVEFKGTVAAEALETRDGEPCLRLRLAVYVAQEGDAAAPAEPGRVTTAARIDGHVWVSTSKGIVWEQDLASEILTSYLRARSPVERHATAKLTAKTRRGEKMPP